MTQGDMHQVFRNECHNTRPLSLRNGEMATNAMALTDASVRFSVLSTGATSA